VQRVAVHVAGGAGGGKARGDGGADAFAAPVTTAVRSANSGMLFMSTRCAELV
jgi:hypothetical protein